MHFFFFFIKNEVTFCMRNIMLEDQFMAKLGQYIVLRLAIHINPVISDWQRMSCGRERPNPPG